LIASFWGLNTEYKIFDLITKAELGNVQLPGGGHRCVPTVYNVGGVGDVLFVTDGTEDYIVYAADLTGAYIWHIDAGTFGWGMNTDETNTYGNFIVWNDGVDDVLFFTTDIGKVYAVYAATGLPYAGWTGPYSLTGGFGPLTNRAGATDGDSLLFYNYQTVLGGDIACLRTADGSEKWLLSNVAGNFKGNDAYGGGITLEGFRAGIAFDAGDEPADPADDFLYTMSTVVGPYPAEAVAYKIDPYAGTTQAYAICNNVWFFVTPVIDKARIYVQTYPYYYGPPNVGQFQAFRKSDMVLDYYIQWGDAASWENGFGAEILLTCEPNGLADLIFAFSYTGQLHCIDGDEGVELFQRRITDVNYGGAGGAIALDTDENPHLVFQTALGGVIDLMIKDVRPRLYVLNWSNRAPVPFPSGPPDPNYPVLFTDVFQNKGCVDLTCEIHIADTPNGTPYSPYAPGLLTVPRDLETHTFAIADRMVEGNSFKMGIPFETAPEIGDPVRPDNDSKAVNKAALADMSWIVTPILYTTTAPDAVESLTVQVNQGMVGRGVFPFWAEFTVMNDPDYWIDTFNTSPPNVELIFLGGCLLDTALLTFGDGQLNSQSVFNTGRLATYYDPPGEVMGFDIDGVLGVLFQGNYVMGVSERRIALSNRSWLEGSTDAEAWVSWLPDLYNNDCKPTVLLAQNLPPASDNFGGSYTTLRGNKVIKNAIDSVQNFDQGASVWWWDDWTAPYDNDSTMGLAMHSTHVGAYQFLQPDPILQYLNNATVEIIEFTERNGDSIPGWKLGTYLDYDFRPSAADVDTTRYDPAISLGWGYCKTASPTAVGGMVKLPFTPFCAVDSPNYMPPMKNCYAIDQRQGMWGAAQHEIPYLDSAYYYMSLAPGEYGHNPLPADEDMAASFTLAEHDFGPNETYTVAVGYFEFQNYPTPSTSAGIMTDLAHQLNKFMGYSRGDMNNDNKIDLADVIYLANRISYGGPGAYPYEYLGNVNVNTTSPYYTIEDVVYLAEYYFEYGPCPDGILKHTAKSIVEY
jgi:hypothetical protein